MTDEEVFGAATQDKKGLSDAEVFGDAPQTFAPPTDTIIPRSGAQMESLGAREFLQTAPGETRGTGDQPVIPIPRIPQQQGLLAQLGAGAVNIGAGLAEMTETPQMIASLPILPAKLTQLIFGGQALSDIKTAYEEAARPETTVQKGLELGGRALTDAIFGVGMVHGAVGEPLLSERAAEVQPKGGEVSAKGILENEARNAKRIRQEEGSTGRGGDVEQAPQGRTDSGTGAEVTQIPEKLPQAFEWSQIHQKAEYVRKANPDHLVTVSPSTIKEGWSRINYWDQGGIVSHLEIPDERLESVLQKETYPRGAKIITIEGGIGGTYPSKDYAGMGFYPDATATKGVKTFVGPSDSVDWMKSRLESGGYKVSVKDVPEPPSPSAKAAAVSGAETPPAAAPQIPEGAKATVKFKTATGELVSREMDAKEAEGIFTKEKSSYQALLDCLGA